MSVRDQLADALAGRYTIEREVGEGGMATVYLARDLRHDRPVALKVLRPELGAVLGVERFLAEIRVTANLQHPNLLPLFDSGEAEGLLYYVMPFVEDETLRARLDRERQLPVEEAVHIAASVAGALDYAHRQGVIHRDLKPENILMRDGQPLVADFGIALAVSNAGGGRITQTGLSLGTPQYMSPEQATGDRAVDARTDIYSLGALTYEMLTGDAPHTGSTSQAVIARLLTEAPRPIQASRSSVPAHVEASVHRALAKVPADRFATAKEFADGLTGRLVVAPVPGSAPSQAGGGRTARERWLLGALALAVLLWAVTGLFAFRRPTQDAEAPEIRFAFTTPESRSIYQLDVAPDGSAIVFSGAADGVTSLWVRRLDATEPRRIDGTEGAFRSIFSPDSREVLFAADGKLRRVALAGGAPQTIADLPSTGSGTSWTWGRDGTILFGRAGEMYRVAASGGEPIRLDLPGLPALSDFQLLPDGAHLLATTRQPGADGNRDVLVVPLDGSPATRVTGSPWTVQFVAPDQLLTVRDNTLYAQTLEMRGFQLTGEPRRIVDNVGVNPINRLAAFSASETGILAIRNNIDEQDKQMWWYSRNGERVTTVGDRRAFDWFSLSPDERHVLRATSQFSAGASYVWVTDLANGVTSPLLTGGPRTAFHQIWSPDSRAVTYVAGDSVVARRLGGTRDSLLALAARAPGRIAYAPDGKLLLMADNNSVLARSDNTIQVVDFTESGEPRVMAAPGIGIGLRFSPDGRWVSYNTAGTGTHQVWVASYPSFENRRQVSVDGGRQARWRGDGRELFFVDLNGRVMSAAVIPGPTLTFETPVALFQGPPTPSIYSETFSVTADGQRFLLADRADAEEVPVERSLSVLVNWMKASGRAAAR